MQITDLTPLARGGGAGASSDDTQSRPLTARGEVAVAPAGETDDMQVLCTTISRTWGTTIPAGAWAPRGDTLPAVGNACCVTFDDLGDAWVGSHWSPL